MAYHNYDDEAMSESIEMYLLRVSMLQESGQPVPLPQLAQELAISPVSAHEMCRKLTERGLVHYEPYKGVTLTTQGDVLARRVLRSRNLWKTFFVEKLNIPPGGAEEIACRFEHVTPDELADRLEVYLQNSHGDAATQHSVSLTSLTTGEQAQIVSLDVDKVSKEYLAHQGVCAGRVIEILAAAEDGALLVIVSGRHLTLSWQFAQSINVIRLESV
jgi:DtxR family transcriptional regulator, Mn-dependent transcriptional regulator